jgi:hypothetical protein
MCIEDDSSSVNVNDESWSISMVHFVSLVFKMSATEIVSVGIELISVMPWQKNVGKYQKRERNVDLLGGG